MSSAEAELNALIKAASETLGVLNMLKSMGKIFESKILTDSNAAKGIVHRLGCGKVKHLEARQLWIQEIVKMKTISVIKVGREQNLSDALTDSAKITERIHICLIFSFCFHRAF